MKADDLKVFSELDEKYNTEDRRGPVREFAGFKHKETQERIKAVVERHEKERDVLVAKQKEELVELQVELQFWASRRGY